MDDALRKEQLGTGSWFLAVRGSLDVTLSYFHRKGAEDAKELED